MHLWFLVKVLIMYLIFILEVPDGVEYEQNREYFRICEKFPCIYNVETEDDDVTIEAETYVKESGQSIPTSGISFYNAPVEIGLNILEKIK